MLRQTGCRYVNLRYVITYVICATQKTESWVYRWLRARAMFDVTRFPAFVWALDVIFSFLSILKYLYVPLSVYKLERFLFAVGDVGEVDARLLFPVENSFPQFLLLLWSWNERRSVDAYEWVPTIINDVFIHTFIRQGSKLQH